MRVGLSISFVLIAASSALAAWVPASQLKNRGDSAFLNCLDSAGLDPVVQSDADYANDSAPFNLRCASIRYIVRTSVDLYPIFVITDYTGSPLRLFIPRTQTGSLPL